MNGVAGSLYERTGLTSVADMAGFVIRSEINYQADRIRRLPGGDELVHYAGITWSLTRQQAAINAQGVRDWGQSAATSLAVWGGEGNGFSYWAGLTLGSYLEGSSNLVAALLVDPLSTAEGLGGAVGAHYQAGGALAVAGMFTGGLEIYESIAGADFLSGEALRGDQRFDRALAGTSGIATIVGGSAILRHAAQHGVRATLEMIATAPRNVLIGAKPTTPKNGLQTWQEFLAATKGQFSNQTEATVAWKVYSESRDAIKTLVIGRLPDTEAAELAGFQRLNTTGWTPAVNDAWVQGVIDARKPVKLVSPINRQTLTNPPGSRFPDTIFRRELHQLKAAGYKIRGGWAYPPGI